MLCVWHVLYVFGIYVACVLHIPLFSLVVFVEMLYVRSLSSICFVCVGGKFVACCVCGLCLWCVCCMHGVSVRDECVCCVWCMLCVCVVYILYVCLLGIL